MHHGGKKIIHTDLNEKQVEKRLIVAKKSNDDRRSHHPNESKKEEEEPKHRGLSIDPEEYVPENSRCKIKEVHEEKRPEGSELAFVQEGEQGKLNGESEERCCPWHKLH